jgi:hypothetical protein
MPPPDAKLLGETYGFWCQTGSLMAAAILAYLTLRSSRAIERRKAAANAIFAGRRDKELTEAVRRIAALHASERSISSYGREENKEGEEARIIRYALNHYEYVSVGITQGVFDETIFKNANFTSITKLYERTKPFIDEIRRRRGSNTAWQELECLACKWKSNPLKARSIRSVEDTNLLKRIFGP